MTTVSKKKKTTKTLSKKAVRPSPSLIGQRVAAFSVKDSKEKQITEAIFKGKTTVLYFYPKDDTSGCTTEGKDFSALFESFKKLGTQIIGVSRDSSKSHDKFICKYGFPFELLADDEEKLCRIFDVIKEKNMYGRKYMGIERSTFVIDKDGKIVYEERKVSVSGHAQSILDKVKSLNL